MALAQYRGSCTVVHDLKVNRVGALLPACRPERSAPWLRCPGAEARRDRCGYVMPPAMTGCTDHAERLEFRAFDVAMSSGAWSAAESSWVSSGDEYCGFGCPGGRVAVADCIAPDGSMIDRRQPHCRFFTKTNQR